MLGQRGIALGQFLVAFVSQDGLGDLLDFRVAEALAEVAPILVALQEVVGALDNGLAVAFDFVALDADVATDHLVDGGHFFEDLGPLLLEGRDNHR